MKDSELIRKPLSGVLLEQVYHRHMERDFPDDELKPLWLLEQLVRDGINSIWGCYRKEELVGYYVLAQEQGSQMMLLDYLAVVPHLRGTGVGSEILALLRESLRDQDYLFIESENPEYAENDAEKQVRERRLRFYHRSGAVEQGVRILLFGVRYVGLTLSRNNPPSPQQQVEDYLSLYRRMLPEDWFEANVMAERRA